MPARVRFAKCLKIRAVPHRRRQGGTFGLQKGSDVLSALSEAFGEDILNTDGTANRAKIAEKAFSSAENTEKLNSIVHPAVTQK